MTDRELQRIKEDLMMQQPKMVRLELDLKTLDSKIWNIGRHKKDNFEKVTKRNKSRFSIVSDESDAFDLAEKILKPQFVLPNGQTRIFNNSGLTYKVAVNMLAHLIYENK